MPSPLPPDAGRAAGRSRPLRGRERWIAGGLAVVLVAVIVITVVSIGSSSHPRRGCLDATVPGPIGATFFKQCGADARYLCGHLHGGEQLSAFGLGIVQSDCRRAGYPVG